MGDSTGRLTADQAGVFFTALRGLHAEPHLASDAKQTVDVLKEIVETHGAKSAVGAGLPAPARLLVESALKGTRHSFAEDLKANEAIDAISSADVGVTWVQYGAAKNGALVEVVYDDAIKLASCLPRVHVAMLSSKSLLPDLDAAVATIGALLRSETRRKPVVSIISGPS